MHSITVRPAKSTEANIIIDFQKRMALETENLDLNHETVTKGVKAVFDNPEKGCYYIAERDGEIAGCMLTTYEWSDWRNGTFIWLQSVYVFPEHRGKGVFKAMYEHQWEMVCKSDELKGLRLYVFHTNHAAHEVYKALKMEDEHYRMFERVK